MGHRSDCLSPPIACIKCGRLGVHVAVPRGPQEESLDTRFPRGLASGTLYWPAFTGFGGSLRRLILAEKTSQASLLIMNRHTLIVPKTPERHQHPKILHTQGSKGF